MKSFNHKIWYYTLSFLSISFLLGWFIIFLPEIEFLYLPISAYLNKYPDLMKFFELMVNNHLVLAFCSLFGGFFLTVLVTGIFYGVKSGISEWNYRRKETLLMKGK